ncbi:MAG: hypothetical protein LLF96_12790 [Eubacteriales bacterium]|nr:hypothetical protein [Eubacteriales bacterium]
MFQIPMEKVSFSIPGSYLTLRFMRRAWFGRELEGLPEGVYLRLVHSIGRPLCFRLIPLKNGEPCPYTAQCMPDCMVFTAEGGMLRCSFEDGDTLIVHGEGLGLRLDMPPVTYEYAEPLTQTRCHINTSASRAQFMISVIQGQMLLDAPYGQQCSEYIHCDLTPDEGGVMRAAVEAFTTVWQERSYLCDMDATCRHLRIKFNDFCERFPTPPERYREAMQLALYILWSSVVAPRGHLKRRGVLMSNSWMTNVWMWDSAINAMALSMGDAELAFDQLAVAFDHQQETGLIPDYINPHDIMWNFTKPPVCYRRSIIDRERR